MTSRLPATTLLRRSGLLSSLSFCCIVAGVNIPNPLMPLYVDRFDLTPTGQAALFVVYLGALVPTLIVVSILNPRGIGQRKARTLLTAGLVLATASDCASVLGAASVPALFTGRMLAGLSLGLATGSAAGIALAALGESARTLIANGAVLGSLIGNLGAAIVATTMPHPAEIPYLLHLVLLLACAGSIVSCFRHVSFDNPPSPASRASPHKEAASPYTRRHVAAGFSLGGVAWAAAGVVLALIPSAVRSATHETSLLIASLPAATFLAAAWIGQAASRVILLRLRAWQVSIPLIGGLLLMALGVHNSMLWITMAGAITCGLGQGPAYSLGLATVTYRLSPIRQGRTANDYAATAYASCAAVTLACGAVASSTSVAAGLLVVALLSAFALILAVVLAGPPQAVAMTRRN